LRCLNPKPGTGSECGAGRVRAAGWGVTDWFPCRQTFPLQNTTLLTSLCTQVNGMFDHEMVEELEKRGIYPSDRSF
jgi:hypothetical protein